MDGEVALVTGGSRGLGFIVARELGRAGCRVAICARDADELERARADLAAEGLDVLAVPADVSSHDQVARLVEEVESALGPVDVLVNNAGIIQVGPVETLDSRDFERAMDVMYWGVVHPTLAVLPAMKERAHGRIVTITSIGGKIASPHLLPYSSAKFAAVGFSEGLAAEVAGTGVTVTTVVPGFMRTGSYLNALFKGDAPSEAGTFSVPAALPGLAMDAERAAKRIVRAAAAGVPERHLTWWAPLASRFHGLFPGLTVRLNGLLGRAFPDAPSGDRPPDEMRGKDALTRNHSHAVARATRPGREAAGSYHEYPGPEPGAHGRGAGGTPVR